MVAPTTTRLRLRVAPGATEVTIRSTVKKPGAERMSLDYDMEKTPTGWKVYDIKVAGINAMILQEAL